MRRPTSILPALLTALLMALGSGCGGSTDDTPVACLAGSGAYLGALEEAPGAVRLSGEVPISACLAPNQAGGELANVGASMLGAATELNAAARRQPGGAPNVRLGYLIGAARRGAEETGGIHAELIRRLRAAALYSPAGRPLPVAFRQAFRQGVAAGRAGG